MRGFGEGKEGNRKGRTTALSACKEGVGQGPTVQGQEQVCVGGRTSEQDAHLRKAPKEVTWGRQWWEGHALE